MLTIITLFSLVLLAMFAWFQYRIARYVKSADQLKRANRKLAEYRRANRDWQSAYTALLAEYNRVCWELQGYSDNVALLARGDVKRIVDPIALGEVSASPMLPMFVEASAAPRFDQDGAIVFANGALSEADRTAHESALLVAWQQGSPLPIAKRTKPITTINSTQTSPQNATTPAVKRELAAVITEVGAVVGDTLSDQERNKVESWLKGEKTRAKPSSDYAKWITGLRKQANKSK